MAQTDERNGFKAVALGSGFNNAIGPVYLNAGERKLAFRVTPAQMNSFGLCHGGAISAFADLQLLALRGAPGVKPGFSPTVSISFDFLAPARLGDWVEAEVTLAKRSAPSFSPTR